jgi:putative DNA primase/helicase
LIDHLVRAISAHVKLSEAAAVAVALWCLHAHVFEAATISPRLAITSPEKRCGKTTLLRVVQGLVPKPLYAANITAAALFRTVEAARPTLLIDELTASLARARSFAE